MKLGGNGDSKFNIWNTNGRRRDITDAYTKYLTILNAEFESGNFEWNNFPKSIGEFIFYKEAVESSPEIFKDINKLTNFEKLLEVKEYKEAFENLDKDQFLKLKNGNNILDDLDKNIEARARHYTSNLVKIGFAGNDRKISPAGLAYLNEKLPNLDKFEALLPINSINMILLRQLAKLRIYSKDGTKYYSPFNLMLYSLLENDHMSDLILFKMIELLNPSFPIEPKTFLHKISTTSFEEVQLWYNEMISNETDIFPYVDGIIEYDVFSRYFSSKKSASQIPVYYEFYLKNYQFVQSKSQEDLDALLELLADKNKGLIIKTAFGGKSPVYNTKKKDVNNFLLLNEKSIYLNDGNNNAIYYSEFKYSKRNSDVREYNRNFRKVALATGIFHSKNGVVELAYKEIWQEFFRLEDLEGKIFVDTTPDGMNNYEDDLSSDFYENISLAKIFGYDENKIESIVNSIVKKFSLKTAKDVKLNLKSKISSDFVTFINDNFPKEKVIEILNLFSDSGNDNLIKDKVGVESSLPTIYEYIVGLAWYYLSDKSYDVYASFNLTMTADFLPEKFAGGGYGDIVAEYDDETVQIEVTLMDKNAQKRGEWEPVLRHATNLTIDNDSKSVTTLFIADELDDNTINIWRAVASVPLKSSREIDTGGRTAKNVRIMPLKNKELLKLLSSEQKSSHLLAKIKESYDAIPQNFDSTWRDDILIS